jgi:galactokinase
VTAWFADHGKAVGGFDAYTISRVLSGSGLSSSAAFEVAVGNMLKALYPSDITPVEIAVAGQFAENYYFGKPSGLMDQTASSVGGFVQIDFADPANPIIEPVGFDLAEHGLNLCIVATGGSHADLTGDYAAITDEMGRVAAHFGKRFLREVGEADFRAAIPELRKKAGDRAILRAMHYYADNKLAIEEAAALKSGDAAAFLEMVTRSGRSSLQRLQNVYSTENPGEQGLTLALALSEELLAGRGGAWRVHGGGFAGTIQAFMPNALLEEYRAAMNNVFGKDACHVLAIRPIGGVVVSE